jgi:PAS domain S-box-containing protein
MSANIAVPTGTARTFPAHQLIVSKTDPKGRISYVNEAFLEISGYGEAEVLGQPHSVIRHPDMPRSVFKLLWDTISAGRELFAYVNNLAKNGDHYWVLAHVTPCFDEGGQIVGYHSNRRSPDPQALAVIEPLYARLRAIETAAPDRKAGLEASYQVLQQAVADTGADCYDRFVFSITP